MVTLFTTLFTIDIRRRGCYHLFKTKEESKVNGGLDTLFLGGSHERILFSHILPSTIFPISRKYFVPP